MKAYLAFYITKDKKLYTKQSRLCKIRLIFNTTKFFIWKTQWSYMVYIIQTLENLIDTVHRLHNQSTWNEKLFVGETERWYHYYLSARGVNHYAINSLLFLTTTREKYVKMYERFINQLRMCSQVMCFIKRLFTYFSLTAFKIKYYITRGKGSITG